MHSVSAKLLHISMMVFVFSKSNCCHQFGCVTDTTSPVFCIKIQRISCLKQLLTESSDKEQDK